MMRSRRTWMFLTCIALMTPVVAATVHGCGDAISLDCPALDGTGYFSPWCTECNGHFEINGCDQCLVDPQLGPSFACYRDAGTDAPTDSATTDGGTSSCTGTCLPVPPFGWEGPALLWMGAAGTAPSCPSNAPATAYEGHADLVAPPPATCTACTCGVPSGTCAPPLQLHASNAACPGGAVDLLLDPPTGWDGSCITNNVTLDGGTCFGAPCTASVIAGPLVLAESGCAPGVATIVTAEPASFATAVLACQGDFPAGACGDLALTCAPRAGDDPSYRTCIFRDGDKPCPTTYPDKQLAYSGFDDQRACAPCACGPSDSACKAVLFVFEDTACGSKAAAVALVLTAAGASCQDVPDVGAPLGSKQLEALDYQPGACAPSGGEPVGTVEAAAASTFCCLASA